MFSLALSCNRYRCKVILVFVEQLEFVPLRSLLVKTLTCLMTQSVSSGLCHTIILVNHKRIRGATVLSFTVFIQLNQASSVASRRRLRSASTPELIVPRTSRSTIRDRAFCMTAAQAWNTLTPSVQSSESLAIFRRRLKTELFSRSFPD